MAWWVVKTDCLGRAIVERNVQESRERLGLLGFDSLGAREQL